MRVYKFLDAKFGIKSLSEKRLKISTLEDLNDPFELIPYDLSDRTNRFAAQRARDELSRNRGMLCFSATWHDPVLWAHYSDKHKGICIGFEIPEDVGMPVQYVQNRLPFPDTATLENAEAMLVTKYRNWAYEREIRVFATLDDQEDGLYFAEFNQKLDLVEVIAGARCAVSSSEIEQALGPSAESIKLIKAHAGFGEFKIVEDLRGFRPAQVYRP